MAFGSLRCERRRGYISSVRSRNSEIAEGGSALGAELCLCDAFCATFGTEFVIRNFCTAFGTEISVKLRSAFWTLLHAFNPFRFFLWVRQKNADQGERKSACSIAAKQNRIEYKLFLSEYLILVYEIFIAFRFNTVYSRKGIIPEPVSDLLIGHMQFCLADTLYNIFQQFASILEFSLNKIRIFREI